MNKGYALNKAGLMGYLVSSREMRAVTEIKDIVLDVTIDQCHVSFEMKDNFRPQLVFTGHASSFEGAFKEGITAVQLDEPVRAEIIYDLSDIEIATMAIKGMFHEDYSFEPYGEDHLRIKSKIPITTITYDRVPIMIVGTEGLAQLAVNQSSICGIVMDHFKTRTWVTGNELALNVLRHETNRVVDKGFLHPTLVINEPIITQDIEIEIDGLSDFTNDRLSFKDGEEPENIDEGLDITEEFSNTELALNIAQDVMTPVNRTPADWIKETQVKPKQHTSQFKKAGMTDDTPKVKKKTNSKPPAVKKSETLRSAPPAVDLVATDLSSDDFAPFQNFE